MKNRTSKLLLALLLTCSVAMIATGCDKLKKEPETEVQTEAPTEAPTESETQTETEPPTEAPTESETETEPETFAKDLTIEEELQNETELDAYRTLYAMDDINVRTQPGTDGEIFDSFDQGEQIIVYGETPNWYKVDVEDYDFPGYVSKQFVSDAEVEPKTEEERAQANETVADVSSSTVSAEASSTDLEYSVEMYAESFPIMASTGANVRSTPAQDGEIIQTIASGTSVTAIGYTDRWYKVDYNGTVGYVNKNLFATE